jgi:hypothetical protein
VGSFAWARVTDVAKRRRQGLVVCRAALPFEGLFDACPGVTLAPTSTVVAALARFVWVACQSRTVLRYPIRPLTSSRRPSSWSRSLRHPWTAAPADSGVTRLPELGRVKPQLCRQPESSRLLAGRPEFPNRVNSAVSEVTERSDSARQVGGDCWFSKKRQRVPARLRTSAARPLRK